VRAVQRLVLMLALVGLGVVVLSGCYSRAQRIYQRAEAFLAKGKTHLAAQEYRRLVVEEPRSALADDALYKLAYLFREEFADPTSAINTYVMLADRHKESLYADDALLWVAYIQRNDMKNASAVRATCAKMKERFPDNGRAIARCHLHLVEALYAQGDYEAAMAEAELLEAELPEQKRQVAAAALIRARAAQKCLGDDKRAVELLEQIVEKYPHTYSAAEAKRDIGLIYYGVRADDEKKTRQALEAAARVMHGVARFSGGGSMKRQQLAALRSLLAFHGVKLDEQALLAVSGAAFDFLYKTEDPSVGSRLFVRNPYVAVAEALGFATNEWSAPDAESSFSALAQAIKHGRPVLVQQSKPVRQWIVVTGYRPAQDQVFFMAPDQSNASRTTKKSFLQRWSSEKARGFGPYYQFSLGERHPSAQPAQFVMEVLRTALAVHEGRTVGGVASGMEAYRLLEQDLAGQPSDNLPKVLAWAERELPELQTCRRAAHVFLQQQAANLAADKQGNLLQAAGVYESIEQELSALAGAIQRANEASDEGEMDAEGWERAARQLHFIMELEEQAAKYLRDVVGR
jgi:TolA-binding protein